jgi:SnoaL-like domain
MFAIKVKFTKFIDDWQPGWVEFEFLDAFGKLHIFNEKVPIVTAEYLDENSVYPQDGNVACEIIERKNVDGREIVKVDTDKYSLLETIKGETVFEIFVEQLVKFPDIKLIQNSLFIEFENNMVTIDYFLQTLYDAFNKREIETVLSMMAEDVKWANGWEGGFVDGRNAVREYWRRQFEIINPQLAIIKSETDADGRNVVTVHQIVKDLDGNLLADKSVEHIFTFEDGLIKTFEIGEV